MGMLGLSPGTISTHTFTSRAGGTHKNIRRSDSIRIRSSADFSHYQPKMLFYSRHLFPLFPFYSLDNNTTIYYLFMMLKTNNFIYTVDVLIFMYELCTLALAE